MERLETPSSANLGRRPTWAQERKLTATTTGFLFLRQGGGVKHFELHLNVSSTK